MLRQRSVLLVLSILFIIMTGFGIILPVLPYLARDLGASPLQMGLMVTVWALAQFIFAPIWGSLSDRIGRKPVMLLGLSGAGITFFLMGLAPTANLLILARLLGGFLSAATLPTTQAYVADITPREERGQAMGWIGATFGLGFVFGPVVGGLLAPLGVKFPFYAAGSAAFFMALFGLFILKESRWQGEETSPAAKGARGLSGPQALLTAIRSPFAIYFWQVFIMAFAGSNLFSMLGFFLMDRFGAAEAETGFVFTAQGLISAGFQMLLLGPLLRRYGEDRVVTFAMLLGVAGFAVLVAAPSLPVFMVGLIGTSGSMSLIRPSVASAVSKQTTLGQGITMGTQASFDSLGRAIGPIWAGITYDISQRLPFETALLAYLVGFVVSLWLFSGRGRGRRPRRSQIQPSPQRN